MFNFDAETWLVVYPHGAGGRLMGLMLSLDPAMAGPDGQHSPPGRFKEYRDTIMYGVNAHWMQDELSIAGSLCEGIDLTKTMAHRGKYIFTGHMNTVWLDFDFYRQCRDLKIIVLSADDGHSLSMLNARRRFLQGGELTGFEYTITQMSNFVCKGGLNTPIANIEIRDYWNPEKFIPMFTDLLKIHNINIPFDHWSNLYLLWQERLPAKVHEIMLNGH